MQLYKVVVLTNALPGREKAFNKWFDEIHLPDVLRVPGFINGQRFTLASVQREGASRQWQYMALYEVRSDHLAAVIDELRNRHGTERMRATNCIEPGGFVHFYMPISELAHAPEAP